MLTRRALTQYLATAGLALSVTPGWARLPYSLHYQDWANARPGFSSQRLELSVLRASDNLPLPMFVAPGSREVYLAADQDAAYVLHVRNLTPRRLLVVPSVDGVNALTGQTASVQQSGYVLEPHSTVRIEGWRKSLQEVARFVFSAPSQAYATQTGRPANLGVIGFAVFEELPPPPPMAPAPFLRGSTMSLESAEVDSPAGASSARSAQKSAPSMGTGHGSRETSVAVRTTFERASSRPAEVVTVRYEGLSRLVAAGIAIPREVQTRSAFPADEGFVPDPPGRLR